MIGRNIVAQGVASGPLTYNPVFVTLLPLLFGEYSDVFLFLNLSKISVFLIKAKSKKLLKFASWVNKYAFLEHYFFRFRNETKLQIHLCDVYGN